MRLSSSSDRLIVQVGEERYIIPTLFPGDIVTVVMSFGFSPAVTLTSANAVVKDIKNDVDAKGIAMFTLGLRLTQVPTVYS